MTRMCVLDGLAIGIPIIKFNRLTYLWTLTNLTIASSPFKLYCIVVHTYCRILLCVAPQLVFLFDPSFIYLLLTYFLSLSISLIHFISIPSPELSNVLANALALPILYRFLHRYIINVSNTPLFLRISYTVYHFPMPPSFIRSAMWSLPEYVSCNFHIHYRIDSRFHFTEFTS